MPALEPVAGVAGRGRRRTPSMRARWSRRRRRRSCGSRPDEALGIGATGGRRRRPGRDRRARGRLLGGARSTVDELERRSRRTSTGRCPTTPASSARARSPACPAKVGWRRRDAGAASSSQTAYADELAQAARMVTAAAEASQSLQPITWHEPRDSLRRRDRRRRRARAGDRVLPRDAPRDHERRGRRGRLHRVRQHRPEHDDHPLELRGPRGDPLLRPLAASCTQGLEAETGAAIFHRAEGPRLDRPHRDGDADRARPRA